MALEDYMLSCPTKKYLGIDCLGCGTQRALALVLEGKFVEAFQMFPAIYFVIGFFTFTLLNFVDRKRNYHTMMIVSAILSALTMIISYVYKHFIN